MRNCPIGPSRRGARACVSGTSLVERARASLYGDYVSRLDRITSDPAICHGEAVIRGLRYPVQTLLELMSSGMTVDEILADYEDLQREDLLAALEYAAVLAGGPFAASPERFGRGDANQPS